MALKNNIKILLNTMALKHKGNNQENPGHSFWNVQVTMNSMHQAIFGLKIISVSRSLIGFHF